MRYGMVAAMLLLAACGLTQGAPANVTVASRVAIVTGRRACEAERLVAGVLAQRIQRRSAVQATVLTEDAAPNAAADLVIHIGLPQNHDALAALCAKHDLTIPTDTDPGPEGFAVRTAREGDQPIILAAGVDKRGVLYAAGEILRQIAAGPGTISVASIDVRTAPAYRYRGACVRQGGTMRDITGARAWTNQEFQECALDYALAGANIFYAGGGFFDFCKSFDLLTTDTGASPNHLYGAHPPEWQASERGEWVCPSVPEARKALIAQWDKMFRARQDLDVFRFFAGDPGGCRCPRCAPWGKTYTLLCEELAQIWLKYHPNSEVQITNQDLDNAGDQFIFDYLNQKPRTWLSAIVYGPGSNALSPYFRKEQRGDLRAYQGDGPVNRYLRETLHDLPKYQNIVNYSDITHWFSAQYQVAHPEPHLVTVFGRRTFHVRPRAYYRVFHQVMPFTAGDIIYSEGYHDEFQQYLWYRLLWDPNRSLEDIMVEYARLHFGAAAAPEMVAAMLQLEENLEAPLATNEGIDRYYALVKSAGWKIPAHIMRDDHRWREHMQKAALDKYVQLLLRRQTELYAGATQAMDQAVAAGDAKAGLAALAALDEPIENPDMAALRAEAGRLGLESDATYGVRNTGYFRLDQDFLGMRWLRKQVERARAAGADREMLQALEQTAHYEDPGPGGFYDDLGDPARQPRLVKGDTRNVSEWMDPSNRPTQSSIAYSFDEGKGVTLRYAGLDPQARYRVRLTMVAPRMPSTMRARGGAKQSVVANGRYLARDVAIGQYAAQQFEYDLPQELTRGGQLELWLEKSAGETATVASEVWLIRG